MDYWATVENVELMMKHLSSELWPHHADKNREEIMSHSRERQVDGQGITCCWSFTKCANACIGFLAVW